MQKYKNIIEIQKKILLNSVIELNKYINLRNKSYKYSYEIHDFFRYQDKCLIETNSIFGKGSDYSEKIKGLSNFPLNENGKVEIHYIKNVFGSLLGIMEGALSTLKMQNSKKKYQIFISSTYIDLREYRQAAYDIITSEGHFPAGMENFIATSMYPEKYIKNVIDDSDYYVLIIGQRYGSIVPDKNISFTEMEYEYAKKKKISIIPLIYNGSKSLSNNKDNQELLNKFVEKVKQENTVMFFKDAQSLKLSINQSLNEAIREHPMPGWIKIKN